MKRRLEMRNSILLTICSFLAAHSVAARTYTAALPAVRRAAFYRIALSPHVSAIGGAAPRSLRLYDREGREQPYLIGSFSAAQAMRLGIPDLRVPVPVAGFSQTDSSDKCSYLRVRFDEAFVIDRLSLRFDGPRFYSRIISFPEAVPGWQRRIRQGREIVIDEAFRTKELLLVIRNDDNPPLRLESVGAEQHRHFLTAWLEPGQYSLGYSDSDAVSPRYDITELADSLSTLDLTILEAGQPRLLIPDHHGTVRQRKQPPGREHRSVKGDQVLVWTIIGAILLALLLATRALAGRIGSLRDED